jgi:hypothetical protein
MSGYVRDARNQSDRLRAVTRARMLRFGGVLALTLILLLGWRVFKERDFDRIPVDTPEDLDREMEGLRASLRIAGMSAAIAPT